MTVSFDAGMHKIRSYLLTRFRPFMRTATERQLNGLIRDVISIARDQYQMGYIEGQKERKAAGDGSD